MAIRADHSSFPGAAPLLVGRDHDLGILREHLVTALTGHGRPVLIGGEAGIGKTALAEALCREARQQGALVLVGRCYDLTETPPYGPWVELFGRYRPADDGASLPAAFAQRGTVGIVVSQAALFQQVLDFLTALASQSPLLLFLDDLHWADPASLDLLRVVARNLVTLPLLLIVTYRADELTRHHPLYQLLPALVRESAAERLDLHALDDAAVSALADVRYRLPAADTDRLIAYVQGRAEGNALFVGELLRALEEAGVLRRDGAGWALGDLRHTAVPTLLRQVIDGRLARLGEQAQSLLRIGAVIGQEVPVALWAAVADARRDALVAAIEEATAARLVEAEASGTHVRFRHALIREALYEEIMPLRRRDMHRAVGEALSTSPDPDPDAVASHFQRAGDDRAHTWLMRAGDRAERAYAWKTATARFEAALALVASDATQATERAWLHVRISRLLMYFDVSATPLVHANEALALAETLGDAALAAYARGQRAAVVIVAGDVERALAEFDASLAALQALSAEEWKLLEQRAAPIVRTSDWRSVVVLWLAFTGRFAEARVLGEAMPLASGYVGSYAMGIAHAYLGEPDLAAERFARGHASALHANDHYIASYTAANEAALVVLPYRTEDIAGRHRLMDIAEEEFARAANTGGIMQSIPPRVTRLPLLLLEGAWDEAEHLGRGEWMRDKNLTGTGDYAIRQIVLLAYLRGDTARARSSVREMLPGGAGTKPGSALRFANAIIAQQVAVLLALDDGDLTRAKRWLDAHDRWLAWSGAVLGRSEGQTLWARYHRQAGDRIQAREHAEHALRGAIEPRQPIALLAAHRLLGELDTEAGRFDSSADHLCKSLEMADACAAPYERALTLLVMAELRLATGARADAAASLDEARAICTPLGARPTLARVDALAVRATAHHAPLAPAPGGLSAREVEVLRLVATGLSNAEVAERLSLSPRTINTHLTAIYTKLNVTSRGAAIRVALDHDLR